MRWIHSVKDKSDLKQQYHRLAKEHHPDRGGSAADMTEINAEAAWWAEQVADKVYCAQHGLTYAPPAPPIAVDDFDTSGLFVNQGPAQGYPQAGWTLNIDDAVADALARHLYNLVDSEPKMAIAGLVWLVLAVLVGAMAVSVLSSGNLFSIGM